MSYGLSLYFRGAEFPENDWLEILSWLDAIERIVKPETLKHQPNLKKEWFIPVGNYGGIFFSLVDRYPRCLFKDEEANWEVSIDTGSGYGLRQFFGYTLCYCALTLIPGTSVWDVGEYMDTLYDNPDEFLKKVNALIDSNSLYSRHKRRLVMQKMGVMDENFQLIPDPDVLKLAAKSDLYDGNHVDD